MNRYIILSDGYIMEDNDHLVIRIYKNRCKLCMGISYQLLFKYKSDYLMQMLDDLEHGRMSCGNFT